MKNKTPNKHGVIRLRAFETKIKWFVGDFNDFVKKYKLEKWELDDSYIGLTLVCDNFYIIYSNGKDNYNTIPHEAVHAVARMSEHRDILFDGTNHEMIAYLVGYVSGEIFKGLNKQL